MRQLGVKLHEGKKDPAADIIAEKLIAYTQRRVRTPTALYLSVMGEFKLGERKPN